MSFPWHQAVEPRLGMSRSPNGHLRSPDSTSANPWSVPPSSGQLPAQPHIQPTGDRALNSPGGYRSNPFDGRGGNSQSHHQAQPQAQVTNTAMLHCPLCPSPGLVPANAWSKHLVSNHRDSVFTCYACEVRIVLSNDVVIVMEYLFLDGREPSSCIF